MNSSLDTPAPLTPARRSFSVGGSLHSALSLEPRTSNVKPPAPSAPRTLRRDLIPSCNPATPLDGIAYRSNRPNSPNSFIALLLPHLFPVSPLLHHSYEKMGVGGAVFASRWFTSGWRGAGALVLPTSNLELPTSRLRLNSPLRNFIVPMHLETKLHSRKNPPLSKPFIISILQDTERLRPYPPLLSPLESTMLRNFPKKRPCPNPLSSITSRPLRKRPCLSPSESRSYIKIIFFGAPRTLRFGDFGQEGTQGDACISLSKAVLSGHLCEANLEGRMEESQRGREL